MPECRLHCRDGRRQPAGVVARPLVLPGQFVLADRIGSDVARRDARAALARPPRRHHRGRQRHHLWPQSICRSNCHCVGGGLHHLGAGGLGGLCGSLPATLASAFEWLQHGWRCGRQRAVSDAGIWCVFAGGDRTAVRGQSRRRFCLDIAATAADPGSETMTIQRIPLTDISREVWLERRRNYINASEAAIVVGEAQWGSPAELYAEKKGLRPPLKDMTGALRRGNWGESSVFDALAETYPQWEIQRAKIHVVDKEKRQACTPDGFARAPDRDGIGVVQAKVVARNIFRNKWLENPEDTIEYGPAIAPAAYRIQTLHEMMLNDCAWGVLAVLINGEFTWDFRLFDVQRDAVVEDRINYRIADFFARYLDPCIMPPFEPQKDELLVRQLYPRDSGTAIDLTRDNRVLALVEDLTQAQSSEKQAKDLIKVIKTELQTKMGEHSFGLLPNGKYLSWKTQHTRAYTVDAYDSRVFRVLKGHPKELE